MNSLNSLIRQLLSGRNRSLRGLLVLLGLLLFAYLIGQVGSDRQDELEPVAGGFTGQVVSVADGDTISVRKASGKVERVRLLGINTPEVHDPVECGGPEASSAMNGMVDRAEVIVTPDPTQDQRDRFGRVLGYVELDGLDLGLEMIDRGLAIAYPFGKPFQRYDTYRKAEQEARGNSLGTWARCEIERR